MAVAEDTTDVVIEERAAPMTRRLLAEFVGTLVFVAVGTGTATVMALGPLRALGGISEALGETGNEPLFEGLLSNQLGDVFPVAFAFATALAVLVYALGGISGAHFNPAVTFSLAVARRFKWSEVPIYWVVQILGGIAGAFIIAGIYGHGEPSGAQALFGGTVVSAGVNQAQALLAEAFITFILVTAIMAIAVDPRAPKGWSGLIIGLGLAAGILVTSAATGGSANFARSLGPFVASLFFDHPPIPWADLLIYAAGPLIGGAAAALVYESVTGLEEISPAPRPGAATGSPLVDGDVHYDAPLDEGLHDHPHDHPHDHGEGKDHTH
ncbi:MAG: MIP/aquaporin family protein [Actinomycetota bacterium]